MGQRRALDATDRIVLDVARGNPTDGTRMVAALAAREARGPVNRKRVQRLMREQALLQPKRFDGRQRPGYFQVTRPDELWHLDMPSVWVGEHGWCYLNAAIDCCTREIVGWALGHPLPRRRGDRRRRRGARRPRRDRRDADARDRQRHGLHEAGVPGATG